MSESKHPKIPQAEGGKARVKAEAPPRSPFTFETAGVDRTSRAGHESLRDTSDSLLNPAPSGILQRRPPSLVAAEARPSPADHARPTFGERDFTRVPVHTALSRDLLLRVPTSATSTPASTSTSTSTPTVPPVQQAMNAIAAFRGRTGPQAFAGLDRNAVADGLAQRVANPSLINQSGLPVCGVAAAVYAFAQTNIVGYVNFAIELFENGRANMGSLRVRPGGDLRSCSPGSYSWQPGLRPSEVDWLVLSSIRDSENTMIDFEGGPSETSAGGTSMGEIADWLRDLGFRNVRQVSGDSVDDARALNSSVGPGTYITLFIDAHMIDTGIKKSGANHFIVLVSPFTIANGNVSFRCWTWGGYHDVQVPEATFNRTFFGAVVASN